MGADTDEFSILIVDDQERNLVALEAVLRDVPARVIRASSGEQALAHSLRHRFALAILDVQMPGMDGYELAELLVGQPSDDPLPIIFVTAAYPDDAHRLKGYSSGAVDYLLKPIEPVVLLAKVGVFLELARARAVVQLHLAQRTSTLAVKSRQLTRKGAFHAMLALATKSLFDNHTEDAFRGVQSALASVSAFIGAGQASAYLFRAGMDSPATCAEWTDGPAAEPGAGAGALAAALMREELRCGEIVALLSLAGLPVAQRTPLELLGVQALLLLPIIDGDQGLVGALCFCWWESGATQVPDLAEAAEQLALLPNMIYSSIERVISERQRFEALAQHRFLFESISQGVVYQDAAGRVIAANATAAKLFGVTPEDLLGSEAANLGANMVDETGAPLGYAEIPAQRARRSGQAVSNAVIGLQSPEGACRWLIVDAVPVFRPGETTPYQVYSVFSDLAVIHRATEAVRRAAKAEEESRAKSDLLASVSHEIRTPLNVCLGYTELLLREEGLSAQQREYLQAIDRSGAHLVALVNNVLDMSRMEAGETTIDRAGTDLRTLLDDVERMFRMRAREKGLGFTICPTEPLPVSVGVDVSKVRQILINLVGNAIKFTPTGWVQLRVQSTPLVDGLVSLKFSVADTGIGVADGDADKIFKPFVQVSPAQLRSGSGLGLSVSQRFVHLMGGDLSVTSNPGGGSVFEFEVAVAAQFAANDRNAHAPPSALASQLALGIGAATFDWTAFDKALAGAGIGLETVTGVDHALARCIAARPAVIVLAERLGTEAAAEIVQALQAHEASRRIPLVGICSNGDPRSWPAALLVDVQRALSPRIESAVEPAATATGTFIVPAVWAAVPAPMKASLARALRLGYVDEIRREVSKVAAVLPAVPARVLLELADRFEFGELARLVGVDESTS